MNAETKIVRLLDSALTPRRRPTAPQTLQSLAAAVDRLGGPGSAQRALQGVTGGTFQRIAALSIELARLTSGEAPPAPETAARSYHRPVATRPRASDDSGNFQTPKTPPAPRAKGGSYSFEPPTPPSPTKYPHFCQYATLLNEPFEAESGGPLGAAQFFAEHRSEILKEEAAYGRAVRAELKGRRGY